MPPLFQQKFVSLAYSEGLLKLQGNQYKAGYAIEKYLAVSREVLGQKNVKYLDIQQGYEWCCAYVYYLLTLANYTIEISPLPNEPSRTLASVNTWCDFAISKEIFIADSLHPHPGDLVLFDNLIENVELDHIGIVIEDKRKYIITSEGNYHNAAGIFKRKKDTTIRGYIRLI